MKILLIDSHALFCDGLRHILQQLPDGVDEILEAGNFSDGLKLAGQNKSLDLVLLELKSPGCEGAISVKFFHQRYPHIPVVVLSSENSWHVINKALSYGASGFVCKSSTGQTLLSALTLVLSGGIYAPSHFLQRPGVVSESSVGGAHNRRLNSNKYGLTVRQMDVLRHLSAGLSYKEIAATINISEGTVKAHLVAVYQILGVKSRMEAIRIAKQLELFAASLSCPQDGSALYETS